MINSLPPGNLNIEEILHHPEYSKIIGRAVSKWQRLIDQDELNQIKYISVWKSLKSYKDKKGSKFTTWLFKNIRWQCYLHYNKNRKYHDKHESLLQPIMVDMTPRYEEIDVDELLSHLGEESKLLVEQYYLKGMTIKEISQQNGYSNFRNSKHLSNAIATLRCILNTGGKKNGSNSRPSTTDV